MKTKFKVYVRQLNPQFEKRYGWQWELIPELVRVVCEAEGYAIVRKPKCLPFIVQIKELYSLPMIK